MSVTIFGSSDDLVCVEGDISAEFDANDCTKAFPAFVACSDGTLLRVHYADGVWRIAPEKLGTGELAISQAQAGDEDNNSDVATLTAEYGDIQWVAYASDYSGN